jgi:hypothetical protein
MLMHRRCRRLSPPAVGREDVDMQTLSMILMLLVATEGDFEKRTLDLIIGEETTRVEIELFVGDWNEALRSALSTADRLVVRSGGMVRLAPGQFKEYLVLRGERDVAGFVAGLEVTAGLTSTSCSGSLGFDFFAGDQLLATLSLHGGGDLRWSDGPWTGDAPLTAAGARFLCAFLLSHGVPAEEVPCEKDRRPDC